MDNDNLNEELEEIEDSPTILILNDENDQEIKFEFLDLIEYEDEEYIVLMPVDSNEDEGEILILKYQENLDDAENPETYISIEDENVLDNVYSIFKDKWKDVYNFVED